MWQSMGAGVEGPGTVNFDMPRRSFTVVSFITFEFQHGVIILT